VTDYEEVPLMDTATEGSAPERDDAAAVRLAGLVSPEAVDRMLADADAAGLSAEGLLAQLTKTVLERALGAELDDHLGYVKGDPAGNGSGNSRNGSYDKTVTTAAGPVRIEVPRDRNGSFEPRIVPKRQRRLGQVDDMILSLYARGMTTRDIQAHLAEVYGAEVSPALISNVTSVVAEEITAWQTRPLDQLYPIIYIDALMVKVRDGGTVDNKAAHLAIGVDLDGYKHVLGIWLAASEGARFWGSVLTELRNRGIKDVLFVCCDGLGGLPEAIEATWPKAIVQSCVIHLIRASMRYVSHDDRKKVATALRPIYTAVNEAAAKDALEQLRGVHGKRYPGLLAAWDRAWAGSSGALLRRSPLRTGRASRPRIRLKQARRHHQVSAAGCRARSLRRAAARAQCVCTRREAAGPSGHAARWSAVTA
jgi:putative transposase